jgi:PIN domain nuclease of toxin-antitoxin system
VILLDTNSFLWSSLGDSRLGESSRRQLETAQLQRELYLSPISVWEVAMLVDKGRLTLTSPTKEWVEQAAGSHDLRWAGLTAAIAADAGHLPGRIHRDPADRMIIATARSLNCPLLTADRKILDYAKAGHVQALDARR